MPPEEPEYLEEIEDYVKLAGLDPATDFRNADLTKLDFGESDVAGWDLSGSTLHGSDLSRVKNIDQAILSETTDFGDARLPHGVTSAELMVKVRP